MDEKIRIPDSYQIEVSGWGLNDVFFVESSNLSWSGEGEKKLMLSHAVSEGATIFVRLIAPKPSYASVPVAYEVRQVQPMNPSGLCEMRLLRILPQFRNKSKDVVASLFPKASSNRHEKDKKSIHAEQEEVLYEA
jgi:hypothetical protein